MNHAPATPVARFRQSRIQDGIPAALDHWRVTTADPDVASAIHSVLGGRTPALWPSASTDNLEVLSTTDTADVIVEDIRYRVVGSDGADLDDERLTLAEHRGRARTDRRRCITTLIFRLPGLGGHLCAFRSSSWDLALRWQKDGLFAPAVVRGPAVLSIAGTPSRATNGHPYPMPVVTLVPRAAAA